MLKNKDLKTVKDSNLIMPDQNKSNIFSHMQHARLVEEKSPHEIHKVGALLQYKETSPDRPVIARPNIWPDRLENTIGRKTKLGNASTTIHAELATLCDCTHATAGATMFVTDLPCPNCAKTMAEAGVQTVYVDAHSHDTPLGKKMAKYFESVSLLIFAAANITVIELDLEKRTEKIWHAATENKPPESELKNLWITDITSQELSINTVKANAQQQETNEMPYAACLTRSKTEKHKPAQIMTAILHPSLGLTQEQSKAISEQQDKYSPNIRPINRLIGACARYGLDIIDGTLISSQTPTSREFVNMVGAGLTKLYIEDRTLCRDDHGLIALQQIEEHKIIDIIQP